eukprot:TRINITY_DN429_c0_g1_i4.p1 TRINITY_DN429_c0_g1~~TRINITY_DN429_c0_g1_i4.p1  ORF type:complete len:253 (+),score=79.99 TRINITY_DN429_c0_g1_i4:58-759(+)
MSALSALIIVAAVLGVPRPGPPNKGMVEWISGGPMFPIDTVEVETTHVADDPMTAQVWSNLPPWMDWSTAHFVRGGPAGSVLELSCPNTDGRPCTFFIVLYNCMPCSTTLNGGLPATLLTMGWEAGSCGPQYIPFGGLEGEAFNTVVFKHEVASGEFVDINLTKDGNHMLVLELSIGQQCSLVEGSSNCAEHGDMCVYKDGACVDRPMCPKWVGAVPGTKPPVCKCVPLPVDE